MSDAKAGQRPSVGIVGIGLIGGSIGLALRDPSRLILGCDLSPAAERMAVTRQCIDRAAPFEEVAQADVVFIGVPPGHVVEVAERVESSRRPETIVSDCSSVKSEVADWAAKGKFANFVPGHPMAGHEKSGCEFSSAWLFRNARWILTPNPKTSSVAIRGVESLIKEMGAIPVRLKPTDHDRHVALLSHLPHVVAAALVLEAEGLEHWEVGAGSWKDLTRVGGVDPKLWSQIFYENRVELSTMLAEFENSLRQVRNLLDSSNSKELETWLAEAQKAKSSQIAKTTPAQAPAARGVRRRKV